MNQLSSWSMESKWGIVLLCASMLSACGAASATENQAKGATAAAELTASTANAQLEGATVADLVTFKELDTKTDWIAETSTSITLNGTSATVSGSGAEVSGSTVKITAAGTYVLSGKLSDGQIVVEAADEDDVQLVLNGVELHDNDSAPIYVKAAGNAIITLGEGTENVVSDGKTYVFPDATADEPNAAIFSKADLTINGTGKLSVTGNYNNGINGKDDLKIVGGTVEVEAVDDGILGKDMVAVQSGDITVKAGGDGIKSTNDIDAEKGFVAIAGGAFNITADADGIQAETMLVVDGGTFNIVTGGGNENGEAKTRDNGQGGQWGKPGAMNPADAGQAAAETTETSATTTAAAETESQSKKGLKGSGDIIVNNGSFTLDSADDAVHGNANVSVLDGKFGIASGDDGIHADAALAIAGGSIDITKSYEGLEGGDITVSGGEIRLSASDDGVNVSGGNDAAAMGGSEAQDAFSESASNLLAISGGYVYVNAVGDGLDANGSIAMSGGTVLVSGPTSSGNGTLDYDGSFELTGGILAAAGSSGMAQAPSDASSQYSVAMTFPETQQAGTLVHLEDSEGNEIMTFAPAKNYQTVILSSPDLKQGSYALYTGGSSTGSQRDGMYADGKYAGGTKAVAFDITDSITTWLNESGVTTGNANRGPGGGGGGRGGMRPQGDRGMQEPPADVQP
ncbi:carbohydrate-binding domain-containing protein [Paenibacillus macerans]|uniref:carbohydrate-binding domain-containing protein n=1 Tax=Paenibacillus macerans TaxID=44252 RepID=UPI003D317463